MPYGSLLKYTSRRYGFARYAGLYADCVEERANMEEEADRIPSPILVHPNQVLPDPLDNLGEELFLLKEEEEDGEGEENQMGEDEQQDFQKMFQKFSFPNN
jgi:hypothetical protein